MTALAASSDLTRFGYDVPVNAAALLDMASTRIRLAAGHQTITADTSTVSFPCFRDGGFPRLWQFPVTGVTSVTLDDDTVVDAADWKLIGNELRVRHAGFIRQGITVVYTHGYTVIPDALIEITCSVAMRLKGTKPDRDPALQAQTIGDVSQTFSAMYGQSAAGLLPGEEAAVRRFFYYRG